MRHNITQHSHSQILIQVYCISIACTGEVDTYAILELKVYLQPTQSCSDFLVSCLGILLSAKYIAMVLLFSFRLVQTSFK